MRLTKIKLAGFKSFVDPTHVGFPAISPASSARTAAASRTSSTRCAGSWASCPPSTCAATRWRTSSSTAPRRASRWAPPPSSWCSTTRDGKIGGAVRQLHRGRAQAPWWRATARSSYFLNGARCRRKDITQLFLGTGLGSRSYAIIEQGMISRVIEAKPDDMRAFVEEAAGISRYKERRKETEARIADTRENLERLQDVRDEVEKQIRHLQRQAATARRYQALKETGAPAHRRSAGAASARARQRRRSARQRGARARARDAGCAGRPALGRSGHREAARLPYRAVRARSARAGPLLRSRRGDLPHRAEHPAHARAARAAEATISRRRAAR